MPHATPLDGSWYLHIQAAAARLDAALAAADALDQGHPPPVPGCPDWDLRDLAVHLGGVHRWAADAVAAGDPTTPTPERPVDAPAAAAGLRAWLADGVRELLATLQAADPARPCWGFGPPPRTVAFWRRRMPHETALHAWDAARAAGLRPGPLDAEFAADGVDEVVTVFVPRQVRLRRLAPLQRTVEIRVTDVPHAGPWRLSPAGVAGTEAPDAVLAGPAETLLLLLWRRVPLDAVVAGGVAVEGDADVARSVLMEPLTP